MVDRTWKDKKNRNSKKASGPPTEKGRGESLVWEVCPSLKSPKKMGKGGNLENDANEGRKEGISR